MKFVSIPSGTFMMGSPKSEEGRDSNEIQHQVTLTQGFSMQTTEVTQGQWTTVMGSNPSTFKGNELPVGPVSWDDAQEFIQKLNAQGEGTYRLPTEAEWEYAARAGTTTAYACGDSESCLGNMAWYDANSGGKTHPVAQKQPNAWGLYDMHGNVYEWVQDWYGEYPSGSVSDPVGPVGGYYRVIRGGGWYSGARNCRSANRDLLDPSDRGFDLGFRLVREP